MSAQEDFERLLATLPSERFSHEELLSHSSTAVARKAMLDEGTFSDVTLECQDQQIKCHRTFLAENSDVFKTMFTSQFKEGTFGGTVKIQDITHELMTKIVQFLYSGEIQMEGSEVMQVFQFADMYDIKPLRNVCGKMLYKYITPTVAMTVWQYAKKYHAEDLILKSKEYCVDHFSTDSSPQIAISLGFLESDEDLVIQLLSHHRLNASSENDVFEAILNWTMFDKKKRSAKIEQVLKQCMRPTVEPWFVCEKIKSFRRHLLSAKLSNVMLDLLTDLTTCQFDSKLLCPRTRTQVIDCLTVCHYDMATMALVEYCGNKMKNFFHLSRRQSHFPSGVYHSFLCTRNKADVYTAGESVYFLNDATQLYELCANKTKFTEIDIKSNLKPDHLLCIPSGRIFNISNDNGRTIAEICNKENWRTLSVMEVRKPQITNIKLCAHHSNKIFFFETANDAIHVFDINTRHITTNLGVKMNNPSCFDVVTKGNIACLIGKTDITIIYMDRFQINTMRPDEDVSHGNIPTKKLKLSESIMKSDTTAAGQADSTDDNAVQHIRVSYTEQPCVSATIYGNRLYVLEKVDERYANVFHYTDFNELLELKSGEVPQWKTISNKLGDDFHNHRRWRYDAFSSKLLNTRGINSCAFTYDINKA